MNTMQQEFDAVVQHLYKQGRPAIDYEGSCVYRDHDTGHSCAVGCRIPDSMYREVMDKNSSGTSVAALLGCGFDLPDEVVAYLPMFSDLQNIHDTCGWTEGWYNVLPTRLAECAKKHGLDFKEPKL